MEIFTLTGMKMRQKLQKFTEFASKLLPHETQYLLSIQQFQDSARLDILEKIHENSLQQDIINLYDTELDKRKYSNLKKWIVQRLEDIDVDARYSWMIELEKKIMTDSLGPEEEKQLLKATRSYQHPSFYFTKFFELVEKYRHFLLIRMRYSDHDLTDNFLKMYQEEYDRSRSVNRKIHEVTTDIVKQYAGRRSDSSKWEAWLNDVFYDETLDGFNRFLALIRLTFIGFNYRRYDQLLEKFDYLDKKFAEGQFYSKRILLNYYSNRVMLHSRYQDFEKATYYGHLSVREKNYDFIHYVNNLAAVLLRRQKYEEALQVMKKAYPEMKTTQSFHNRIGFVSFYIKCLFSNGKFKSAENYAESFLRAYKKEIFQYRWHIFFSSYLEVLLRQSKYKKLLKVVRQNQLIEKEKKYQERANYVPTILWFYAIAEFREYQITEQKFIDIISTYLEALNQDIGERPQLKELLGLVKEHAPNVFNRIEERTQQSKGASFMWLDFKPSFSAGSGKA